MVPLLRPGMRVLDIGCGDGRRTTGLGTAVHPVHVLGLDVDPRRLAEARRTGELAAVTTTDFVASAPGALAVRSASVDVVFVHELLAREPDPMALLAEIARVLRPGGVLALSTPDWGRARVKPRTANVDAALRGWHLLWRRGGGDPFAGRRVDEWVARAGFRDIRSKTRFRGGVEYRQLARTIESRLAAALDGEGMDQQLASAARSAWMWVRGGQGEVSQCWVETLAVR